jgi:hypothetical protein
LNRPPLFVLIAIGLLLLLPAGSGRVLLDLAGGLLLVFLVLPVLLGGLGWVGWKVLQSRMQSCSACGAVGLGSNLQCSVCGTPYSSQPGAETPTGVSIPSRAVISIVKSRAGIETPVGVSAPGCEL